MKTTLLPALPTLALASLVLLGCQALEPAAPADTLVAKKVAAGPNPAAGAEDPLWAQARSISAELNGGANLGGKGTTRADLKALYSADTLYLLVRYADPTHSVRRGPYQKQADGSWIKLKDPADKGGDDNVYYEDKWAMIWPTGRMVAEFEKRGCMAMCHEGEGKPYGNKYTRNEGDIADLWHLKGSRTAPWGHADDQYVDHTRYDPRTSPGAGRKSDPGTPSGEYTPFGLVDGKPQFMARDAKPLGAGGMPYIKRGEEVAFDDSRFKAGDEVASYIINPLLGDRADVRATYTWANGRYTSVVTRKLVTGSPRDVQFSDLGARYPFGIAVFDNAQVRHATPDDPLFLVFGK